MHFSLIAALALAGSSALAAAVPAKPDLQKEIQTLEITILNVINDIVQLNKNVKKDYATGQAEFATLISQVGGPQSCSPFVPGKPTNANGAVKYLQNAQSGLQNLSLDLMDTSKTVAKGDFHADVCSAWGYYSGVSTFATK